MAFDTDFGLHRVFARSVVLACLFPALSSASAGEILERAVVRNRLYSLAHRLEVTPVFGVSLVDRLVSHLNFTLGIAYNFSDHWAVEGRVGYAVSGHSGLADQVAQHFLQKDIRIVDDLSSLWEMKANALAGIRWSPIYGKISLVAELPIHFQFYLWMGGGVGDFRRQSVVFCQQLSEVTPGNFSCGAWRTDSRVRGLGSAAVGWRFFTGQQGSLLVELRNYLFADSYLTGIDKDIAGANGQTGTPARSPGLINLVFLDFGYTFTF
jgi:outer membrane beta-barrel protein